MGVMVGDSSTAHLVGHKLHVLKISDGLVSYFALLERGSHPSGSVSGGLHQTIQSMSEC
jgi:hypothetical protein